MPPRSRPSLTSTLDLGRFLEHHSGPALLLGPDGEQVPLPEKVYRVLVEVVEAMREGKVITLVPHTQRLTTQEAADFLGISRPTLVKLLEDGKIPYDQPGRHRPLLFTDLLAYQQRQHAHRRAALDQMTEDASEAGIYGGTPEIGAAGDGPALDRLPGEAGGGVAGSRRVQLAAAVGSPPVAVVARERRPWSLVPAGGLPPAPATGCSYRRSSATPGR